MKKLGTHFMINNGLKEMAANAVEPVVMKKQKEKAAWIIDTQGTPCYNNDDKIFYNIF